MLLHLNMTNIMYDKFSCFTCGYLHPPNIFIDCSHEPALLNGRKNFKSWRKPLNGKHLHKSFYWLLHKKKGVVFSCFQFYALLVPWGLGGLGFQPIITLGRQPAFPATQDPDLLKSHKWNQRGVKSSYWMKQGDSNTIWWDTGSCLSIDL